LKLGFAQVNKSRVLFLDL